ncbi:hypothetical protein [Haladaptatus sp. DYSN1]|uniref:hypothetical protein n=1 Tax=unclassified Haladaptatus TaxID=2622732 RepID=UPI002407183E|nr:hypothetical protein [Haladaptatus sp. DYSN1]
MSEAEPPDIPTWDDDYYDDVAKRLMYNYDLERDYRAGGESFDLYGKLDIDVHKQFLTSALSYGHQESTEHLFARRESSVSVASLERLVELGHDLADEWIEPDERHFGTDFVFVVVAPEIPDEVRSYVSSFSDRTLIKYGYHGQYQLHLVVVAPEAEDIVQSKEADVSLAFALWESLESSKKRGVVGRLRSLFGR